ncbi:HDOD domain-containing protein [Fusibacter ferrireducens]|uniref:HDOD domain-containing protein n=1 Tax=Fusibacter ferrireducens TaxID=2785058 RepID=A0ABR9ZWZ6_9FIRM|nr:HDOD domain-containing protein [Fusibacter ferrireducens]MBF4694129.1 HDOD domain-containing protein [Fusibacter ferrireducens]
MNSLLLVSNDKIFIAKFSNRLNHDAYELAISSSLEEAKIELAQKDYRMVLVDLSEEAENEVLLRFLKLKYPKVIRLAVMNASTSMDYYMPKQQNSAQMSWKKNIDNEELFIIIDKVIAIDAQVKNSELVNLVSNFKHLPTVPEIYNQLSLLIQENASVEEIALKLEEDPAVTSNILKMANSAFYNAKTGSIRQAIMYIGLINVKNIILTNAVFGNDGLPPETRQIHWEHVSLTNKILNGMYQELLGKKLNNNISSVGLLHDIGSIVLMSNFPKEFKKIVEIVNCQEGTNINAVEKEWIGFNHEELGGHLLDLWGLPFPIIEAALYHHEPFSEKVINKELVISMHVANYYAWKFMNINHYQQSLDVKAFSELGITQKMFDVFFENLKRKL